MTPSKPCLKPPNQALNMMAQKNTDAKASECQKCHNSHAPMTAAATETRVTAYFTLEGGSVHQFALDIGIFLLRHITASPATGRLNKKIAPHPVFFSAHKRPPGNSTMERLPMPIPRRLVVKNALKIWSDCCSGKLESTTARIPGHGPAYQTVRAMAKEVAARP